MQLHVEKLDPNDAEALPDTEHLRPAELQDGYREGTSAHLVMGLEDFSYVDTHRFFAANRLITLNPITGRWLRKPPSVEREIWDNNPKLRPYIQAMVEKARKDSRRQVVPDMEQILLQASVDEARSKGLPQTKNIRQKIRHLRREFRKKKL